MANAVRNVNRKASWISVGAPKLLKWVAIVTIVLSSVTQSRTAAAQSATATQPSTVHVDVTPGHVINSFDPDNALGSSIDVLSHDGIDKVYSPHIIQESLSAGWGPNLLSQQQ